MATVERPESNGRKYKVIGTRPIRHDGVDKVTGRAKYGADIQLSGLSYGVVIRSPHAHARILGIDTSQAAAHPGVLGVFTSAQAGNGSPDRMRLLETFATQIGLALERTDPGLAREIADDVADRGLGAQCVQMLWGEVTGEDGQRLGTRIGDGGCDEVAVCFAAGRVQAVHVSQGQTFERDATLITLDPAQATA